MIAWPAVSTTFFSSRSASKRCGQLCSAGCPRSRFSRPGSRTPGPTPSCRKMGAVPADWNRPGPANKNGRSEDSASKYMNIEAIHHVSLGVTDLENSQTHVVDGFDVHIFGCRVL